MYKSEDGSNYTEITGRMPSSGYELNQTKSYCILNGSKDTNAVLKTIDGDHVISNLAKGEKCYLYFDRHLLTAEDTLVKLNITNVKSETPTFANGATTDEGIYKVADGMYGGYSYYWRGAVTNNYVKFANKCWRIVRINGDGTIRLIYDGSTCHANGTNTTDSIAVADQQYDINRENSSAAGWTYTLGSQRPSNNATATSSTAKTQTENWYASNIGNNMNYSSKVAEGKFCNDRSVTSGSWNATQSGSIFNYAPYNRVISASPTLSCPSGDIYTLKVGAITIDEAIFAGSKQEVYNTFNTSYYLYNGQEYWTMSPFKGCGNGGSTDVFIVQDSGNLWNAGWTGVNYNHGLRPVINLIAETKFSSGNGTQSNPYVVK